MAKFKVVVLVLETVEVEADDAYDAADNAHRHTKSEVDGVYQVYHVCDDGTEDLVEGYEWER